jgi:uncharacterized protein (TIRG00374 family)
MKRVHFLIQVLISVSCLVIAWIIVKPEAVLKAWTHAEPIPLFLVFALMPAAVLGRAWRWWYILRQKHVMISLMTMWRVTFIGMALNLILPGSMGDVARSYYGWRSAGNKEVMLSSAIVDKVIALFTLCILGAVCAVLIDSISLALISLFFAIPLMFILLLPQFVPWQLAVILCRKVLKKDLLIDQLRAAFKLDFRTTLVCIIISLAGWFFTNAMYYFACLSFTNNVSFGYVFAVAPLINLVRIIPVSICGLGPADLLILFLFGLTGMDESTSLMASMTINAALIALPGMIGTILMTFKVRRIRMTDIQFADRNA